LNRKFFQPYFPGKIRAWKQSCFECFGDKRNEEDALVGQNGLAVSSKQHLPTSIKKQAYY
jgi:hypothetical protein